MYSEPWKEQHVTNAALPRRCFKVEGGESHLNLPENMRTEMVRQLGKAT